MPKRKKEIRERTRQKDSEARSKKPYSVYLAEDLRNELRSWPKPDRARVGKLIQKRSRKFRHRTGIPAPESRPLAERKPPELTSAESGRGLRLSLHIRTRVVALLSNHRQPRRSASLPEIVPLTSDLSSQIRHCAVFACLLLSVIATKIAIAMGQIRFRRNVSVNAAANDS